MWGRGNARTLGVRRRLGCSVSNLHDDEVYYKTRHGFVKDTFSVHQPLSNLPLSNLEPSSTTASYLLQ